MTARAVWRREVLTIADVHEHPQFQLRAEGLSRPHLSRLMRTLENGEALPPIQAARIGKALYVLDGFHRLAAHKQSGRATIEADVARMALGDARDVARLANTKHGKNLGRADKAAVWDDYVGAGKHLASPGVPKASRVIAVELNQLYSHETIRAKLRALGVEPDKNLEFPAGYKPRSVTTEEDLGAELIDEAETCLLGFVQAYAEIGGPERERLLRAAKAAVTTMEAGGRPDLVPFGIGRPAVDLDI